MSNDAIAFFRKTYGDQLGKLAEEHFNKDLEDTDRETLKVAAAKFRSHAAIGSLIGIGLGVFLAFRVRSARTKMFNAFKAREKPVSVSFADGRTEAIPDVTNLIKPTVLGDVAAYFFFSAGGLFIGGETGLITGSLSAGRSITKDAASRERIEKAFQKFKADALRQEADKLDGGQSVFSKIM
ncbi:hypothetical protein E2P81_ATG03052 [Venturia nashicola]|uniref:Uncharacterized protein n=1 Tax=Venturia nashicola TaxID=86259 RepID=A0A4Z1PEA7_9PEZI|nr:hypothetical protein E6O75_ATG03117 [Venturia nashicola]TLD36163.1 hypothetical protein E2P81_ATG03052 [Venturia nashicola]